MFIARDDYNIFPHTEQERQLEIVGDEWKREKETEAALNWTRNKSRAGCAIHCEQ